MVKNYLVGAVRKITNGWHQEKNQDLYKAYNEMYRMSLASFKHFCQEPFEAVCWTDEVANNDEYTLANWYAIKELWHSEPCNIFWAGADTLMLNPTSLFGTRFHEYRMFNYTDPPNAGGFKHTYNDDLQYYPCTMSEDIWKLGESLWNKRETHPDRHWGFDQIRHNYMFWAQDIPDSDRRHPEMAYQAMNIRQLEGPTIQSHNKWNDIDIRQAHILHFHASRGSHQVIEVMKTICDQLGVTVA